MLDNQHFDTAKPISYQIGCWHVNPQTNELTSYETTRRIEPKAMEVLLYLKEHQTRVVSTNELLKQVWGEIIVTPNTVRRIIAQLRKVLDENDESISCIRTIPKVGYQLIAPCKDDTEQINHAKPNLKTLSIMSLIMLVFAIGSSIVYKPTKPVRQHYSLTPVTSLPGRELNPSISSKHLAVVFSYLDEHTATYRLRLKYFGAAESTELKGAEGSLFAPAWSVKDRLAFADIANGHCSIMLADITPTLQTLTNVFKIFDCGVNGFPQITWSNDGNYLFFSGKSNLQSNYRLYQYQMDSQVVTALDFKQYPKDEFFKIVPSADNNIFGLLSFNGEQSRIWHYDKQKEKLQLVFEHQGFNESVNWCQKGTVLMFGYQGQLWKTNENLTISPVEGINDNNFSYLHCPNDLDELFYVARKRTTNIVSFANPLAIDVPPSQQGSNDSRPNGYHFRSTYNEFAPSWANHSNQIAFFSDRSGTWRLYLSDNNNELVTSTEVTFSQKPTAIDWSPDDHKLLLNSGKQLMVYDITAKTLTEIVNENKIVSDASWSNTGLGIYFVFHKENSLNYYELITAKKETVTTFKQSNDGIAFIARSPNAPYMYYLKERQTDLWRLNLLTGEHEVIIRDLVTGGYFQAFEQGVYFYQVTENGSGTYFYNNSDGNVAPVLTEFGDQGIQLNISFDQKNISYVSFDNYQADIKRLKPLKD